MDGLKSGLASQAALQKTGFSFSVGCSFLCVLKASLNVMSEWLTPGLPVSRLNSLLQTQDHVLICVRDLELYSWGMLKTCTRAWWSVLACDGKLSALPEVSRCALQCVFLLCISTKSKSISGKMLEEDWKCQNTQRDWFHKQ